jgi:hypothetical protein
MSPISALVGQLLQQGAEGTIDFRELAPIFIQIDGLFLLRQPVFLVLGFLLLLGLELFQLHAPADCAKTPGGGNQAGKQAEKDDDTRSQRPQTRILWVQGLEVHRQLLEIEQRLLGCGRLRRGIFCCLLFRQPSRRQSCA